MFVSVVVPCYRSGKTLPRLIERLDAVMSKATTAFEVVLVVDGSPDDTWEVADRLAQQYEPVRAIRLARNYGQHNAIVAGLRATQYEVIVTMDDDLQHPPEEVPKLLNALTNKVDLVYGIAFEEEHGLLRSVASRLAKRGMTIALGAHHARHISAFRAFRAYLRDGFGQVHGPHASVDVTLSWSTTKVSAISVRMDKREEGQSGYTFRTLTRHALTMILGYSVKPLRMVTYLGFLVGVIGMLLFGVVLWLYFDGSTSLAGFTTLASMIAIFSSAQMIALGTLGEYVGQIHASGMGRPTYVIAEITDGPGRDIAALEVQLRTTNLPSMR